MASDALMHSVDKDCVYILFLWNHVNVSLKVSAPSWLIVILDLSCSAFLAATLPAIAQACVWVSVSFLHLFLWHFTSLFLIHAYPQISNKTGANHMCLCFWWWHAPIFLWKLVLFFFRKLNYFLQWFWRALPMTISCNAFYLTAILGITDHVNKLNPAWKTILAVAQV